MTPHNTGFLRGRGAGVRLALVAVLIFAAAGGVGYAKVPERLFAELKEGQSVRVEFARKSCFSHEAYEFEFRRAQTLDVTITRVGIIWDAITKEYREIGRVALGTVNVSDGEAAGLDKTLKFYRRPAHGACETFTYVSVTLCEGMDYLRQSKIKLTYFRPCGK